MEVDVLGSRPGPNKPTVSVDVKQHFNHIYIYKLRAHRGAV